jgi:hypothetical protein
MVQFPVLIHPPLMPNCTLQFSNDIPLQLSFSGTLFLITQHMNAIHAKIKNKKFPVQCFFYHNFPVRQ